MEEKTKNKIEDELRKAIEAVKGIIKKEEPTTEAISWIEREEKSISLSFNFTEKKKG